jgi:hypothetical protein
MIMKHTKLFELLYSYINSFINDDSNFTTLTLFFNSFYMFLTENYHFKYVQLGIIRPSNIYSNKKQLKNNNTSSKITDYFNKLSHDLDFLLSEYKESAESTIKKYISISIKVIDLFFLLKGIFLDEDFDQILNISYFLKNVICKIMLNDIKNITLIYIKQEK